MLAVANHDVFDFFERSRNPRRRGPAVRDRGDARPSSVNSMGGHPRGEGFVRNAAQLMGKRGVAEEMAYSRESE